MIYTLAETFDIARDPQEPTLWPGALMLTGNARAHLWQVTLLENGQPVDLSDATATAKFRRAADGITVTQTATISGNTVAVQLHPDCYRYAGQLKAMLELTVGSGDTAVVATAKVTLFNVAEGGGDAISDPENVIPSIGEIIAQMAEVEQATRDAQDATDAAEEAAENASTQAAAAQAAAAAITGITASAQTLEAGAEATAAVSDVGGVKHMTFGIPRGPQGNRGSWPWYGTAITGNSTVPAAYATGLALVQEHDVYVYTGTDTANAGNEYVCTLGGDAATALWRYLRNSRGVPGAGNVSYVDGMSPDVDGDVPLGAIRYNAAQPDLTDAERAQARANAGAASAALLTAELAADGWTGSGPYTQEVSAAGLLADDVPLADIVLSDTAETAKAQLEAYGLIGRLDAGAGTLTATCYDEQPAVALTLRLKVVR
ncbi:MAG: hypothetical protein VB104_07990 [Candidatus Limiplasma sp.]|nr:hypothetical protein [Candidatus Limiplasma sp.]